MKQNKFWRQIPRWINFHYADLAECLNPNNHLHAGIREFGVSAPNNIAPCVTRTHRQIYLKLNEILAHHHWLIRGYRKEMLDGSETEKKEEKKPARSSSLLSSHYGTMYYYVYIFPFFPPTSTSSIPQHNSRFSTDSFVVSFHTIIGVLSPEVTGSPVKINATKVIGPPGGKYKVGEFWAQITSRRSDCRLRLPLLLLLDGCSCRWLCFRILMRLYDEWKNKNHIRDAREW